MSAEFIDLRLRGHRRTVQLELQLADGAAQRTKVAKEFLKWANEFRDSIKAREKVDADAVSVAIGEAAGAEAEEAFEQATVVEKDRRADKPVEKTP